MGIILIFSHQPEALLPRLNKLHSELTKAVAQGTANVTSETQSHPIT